MSVEDGKNISRRRALGIIGKSTLVAAGAAAGILALRRDESGEKPKTDQRGRGTLTPEDKKLERVQMIDVPASLRGRVLNDLFTHYTGIAGLVPDKIRADFPTAQLPHLWEEKKKRYGETAVVEETRRTLIESYDQKRAEKIGWREFRDRGQSSVDVSRRSLDWNGVSNHFNLSDLDLKLLREFERQIDGTALLAYVLTELMPGTDGALNREMLDFLLRVGGREYLESIPSIGDDKTSVGPYQFTEYAVFDTGSERRGASRVNQYLPVKLRIPGSVAKLRGDDHHKAAYLFAIFNLAQLVRKIAPEDKKTLLGRAVDLRPSLVEFVATAHNLPAIAVRNFRNYLIAFLGRDPRPKRKISLAKKEGKKEEKTKAEKHPPIKLGTGADYLEHVRAGGIVWKYARKTRANYRTLLRS
ncbi:hypothetical protein A3A39_02145 [Candidatus Kaiserbacteria bacterium RIFCSPLOWO2_01_FULL_54_13]|uniref:Uncharacterized protein n=1 Tax=Candidatus Kaiserbacteria bacterium RIFCSPLOWO2_01_FULL_54_13 TaxID=1798512 RepID=A0A1F6F180_9BACT|nr:MAG: hypothetical protein A3A39_02145 [Candidatus Kaiserbacteria bacterium RIFCSPLOWO2_01_FULL_54_13]